MARFDVTDSGAGMDLDVLRRAQDPFFTTRPSGTGLGLPIVQRIVQAHDGSLRLASSPGQGTTATLLIPLGAPDPGSEASIFLEKSG
jgi:signal transduction histidine kinase